MSVKQASLLLSDTGAEVAAVPDSFGRYLQAIRIERGIGLEQVAEETRIAVSTLEAIEAEDFHRLPPDVFLRGFLRTCAKTVGADPAEAVRRYDAYLRRLESGAGAEPAPQCARTGLGRKLAAALMLLAGLVAATLAGYRYWGQSSQEATPPPLAVNADSAAAPSAAAATPFPSEAVKRPPIPEIPKHVLMISAQEESWVKVSIDQGTPSEHTLKAGTQIKLEGQSGFNLLIGNAGGTRLNLDGKPVQVPGKRGEVVNLHLP